MLEVFSLFHVSECICCQSSRGLASLCVRDCVCMSPPRISPHLPRPPTPASSYVGALTPIEMVLGDGAFGKWWGWDEAIRVALLVWLVCFERREAREPSPLSPLCECTDALIRHRPRWHPDLGLPISSTGRKWRSAFCCGSLSWR